MTLKVVPERAGLDPIHSRDVYYGYDLQGLQLFARFDSPSGAGVTNEYDGFGRLRTTTTDLAGGTPRVLFYSDDAAGNRTDIYHSNPVRNSGDTIPNSAPSASARAFAG